MFRFFPILFYFISVNFPAALDDNFGGLPQPLLAAIKERIL